TFDFKGYRDPLESREAILLGLLGRHQAENTALVLAVLDLLAAQGWHWDEQLVRKTLAGVQCRGRVEVISRAPFFVIDAAHNVASIQALLETLGEIHFGHPRVLIFASSVDKDLRGMLTRLIPQFDHVILTKYPGSSRAADPHQLGEMVRQMNVDLAREQITWEVQSDPNIAWKDVRHRLAEGQSVCVTGSFFIAAHLRRLAEATGLPKKSSTVAVPLKG
ncbi:MAG: cyanophycin synthetase, partial [Planctomycetota bacterium]|nr:cyanophycin synthetase [Planctomycetota bacterium]